MASNRVQEKKRRVGDPDLLIYLYDRYRDKQECDPVLVGFEGYTDTEGDISTLVSLTLQKKWVRVEQPLGCCRYLGTLIFTEKKQIADDRVKDLTPPHDGVIDYFWEMKHGDNLNGREKRDLLRFTPAGRVYINAQILRAYILFFWCLGVIIVGEGEINNVTG